MDLLIYIKEHSDKKIKMTNCYEKIAVKNGVSVSTVERSIRYAISSLGVTNKEFILKIMDDLIYLEEIDEHNIAGDDVITIDTLKIINCNPGDLD